VSTTVEYSFNSNLSLADLASEIGRRLGCSLARGPDDDEDIFSGRLFGMHLDLWGPHTLVTDRELDFENFRYQITTETSGISFFPIQVEAMALFAYVLHQTFLADHQGMLTYGLGILLGRYELRKYALYDLVGDKRVEYPEHLVDIRARIARAFGHGP
jgi:hypothetical protein